MALEQKLNLRLSQRLVMTPSLQQAIKLLQMSKLELEEVLTQEMVENPILEDSVESGSEQANAAEPHARDLGASCLGNHSPRGLSRICPVRSERSPARHSERRSPPS